jgi:hypothetical protein
MGSGESMTRGRRVLAHLGGGMGDMLLATPMIEMLGRGGYEVDVCLDGDTRGVSALFEGWPFPRRVSENREDFAGSEYDYYVYGFDVRGKPIAFPNRDAAIKLHPIWDWRFGHHLYSEVEMFGDLARAIDPTLPVIRAPSCGASSRVFPDISSRTCVLVPGGQRNVIIRAWPKFSALAARLEEVAVVGTNADLDLSNRIVFPPWLRRILGSRLDYRGRAWQIAKVFAERHDPPLCFPPHVKNYVGKLPLADTAALIRQAGVVVGNDCGVTHLAVALGKPVIVLLGPTSRACAYPRFWTNVRVIARSFDCQPCQELDRGLYVWRQSMGQCFCPYSLRCMNDIEVDEVLAAVESVRARKALAD